MKTRTTALAALFAAIPLVLAPTAANAIACYGDFSDTVGTLAEITREEFMSRVCQAQLQPGTDRRDVQELKDVVLPKAVSGLGSTEMIYRHGKPAIDDVVEKCYSPEDYCSPDAVGRATRCMKDELPGAAMNALGPESLASSCEGLKAAAATDPQALRDRARAAAESYIAFLRSRQS
ncbi:hypothetical protein [Lentzea flaviverrucosa]|uniref:Secreted protein n=1 Tax=Lentzea flaviverrucosa TaxID=200379 RepID=A0A1H9SD55_9PSEU|nr:hypothetical protein [Lentzea flaviverrucosa]RDI25311.1 hypothetical protein DFR72_1083 [Lentzea flaviverrucosa]SER82515.1 hypothetical protein SAMN05216195_1074 [Lentzea flaviverrucosa]